MMTCDDLGISLSGHVDTELGMVSAISNTHMDTLILLLPVHSFCKMACIPIRLCEVWHENIGILRLSRSGNVRKNQTW